MICIKILSMYSLSLVVLIWGGEIFYIGIISTIGQKIKLFSFCKIKIVSSLILRVVMRIELHSLPSKISDSLTRNGHSCNDC